MKPTLQEIAAMPFPQSEQALFTHYGIPPRTGEPAEQPRRRLFEVQIEYSYTREDIWIAQIEAETEQQAKDKAQIAIEDDHGLVDIDDITIISSEDIQ